MINKTGLHNDIDYVLLDQETLQRRVHELAEKLTNDYRGKNPVFLCILKGSVHFFSDLVRQFDDYCEIDFLAISSYGNARKTSGIVRINKDLDMSITGRHVIIVEDIMDSGLTLIISRACFVPANLQASKSLPCLINPNAVNAPLLRIITDLSFLMNLSWDTVLTMPAHIETCLLLVFLRTRFTLIKH